MPSDPLAAPPRTQLMLHLQLDRRRAQGNVDLATVIGEFPEIIEGLQLSGDGGYWLRIAIDQLSQYEALREQLIEMLPDVRRITASVVLNRLARTSTKAPEGFRPSC
jgi:DNA-binding Lrp family transcriptional regulator